MTTVDESPRKIEVHARTEVLVVGGGPGGLAAAVAAAREGAQTMLLERYGSFGGMITQAGVETIGWYRHEKTVDAGGLGREFEDCAKARGGTQPESRWSFAIR